jgi:ariadne-1
MSERVEEVSAVVQDQISTQAVRILLNHFNWDKMKLMDRLFGSSQEAVLVEARVVQSGQAMAPPTDEAQDCNICYLPQERMAGLGCGHMFCHLCWAEYLTGQIMEEGASQMIECPENCNVIVHGELVTAVITDRDVKLKYDHLIVNNFVARSRLVMWCPGPDCSLAVAVQQVAARPVRCLCGHSFCVACSEDWHQPITCTLLKVWIKKCEDDSETNNWLAAHTKLCPKCEVPIEKNGGCNHMVCSSPSCRNDFCWVCLGPWKDHKDYYSCNKYAEEAAKNERDQQAVSRASLTRYLFYYNRYANHKRSLGFEEKLHSKMEDMMEEMQALGVCSAETQFLKKALAVLCECRRTLMYTYAFAHYLQSDNQSAIFEDNQNDLERATEQLSEFLERSSAEKLVSIRLQVEDKYRYCEGRRRTLLHHVQEGYDKGSWSYVHTES